MRLHSIQLNVFSLILVFTTISQTQKNQAPLNVGPDSQPIIIPKRRPGILRPYSNVATHTCFATAKLKENSQKIQIVKDGTIFSKDWKISLNTSGFSAN
jgi:hypothetical protein